MNLTFKVSNIFTFMCFYCAIFDGLSVLRKEKIQVNKMLVSVVANIKG